MESANKVILKGLRKRCGESKGAWINEFPVVLWSYNTTPQSATGETPYRLVYGEDAMISLELSERTWRVAVFNEEENEANLKASLDLLPEAREDAHLREVVVKQRAGRGYNAKLVPQQIEEGDLVLRRKTRSFDDNKLTSNWEGPFRVLR
ncbi:uncharacterized protein LOC130725328 [Lotus japonicus]|uniref:uncharacterized protein LOC130725328 n=1 Tax=Lotus japonicus TaxID=34305 RepID=UPI00258860CE|nr:uncharacterized protein LOC130725328 [Lotus japonicus]